MANTIQIKRRVGGSGSLGALGVGELGVNIDDNNKLYVGTAAGNKLTALPTSGGTLTGALSVTSGQAKVISGAVSAPSFSFTNDTDTGMSRPTTNALNFVTGGAEAVRIDASGNLSLKKAGSLLILDTNNEANISGDTNGMYFKTWSGSAHVARLTIDGPSGAATFAGALTVDGGGATQAANSDADDLVVRGDGNRGISVITGTNKDGRIVFSDTANTVVGGLRYDHNVPHMQLLTEGSVALTFDSSQAATFSQNVTVSGNLTVGGTTTTVDTQNLLVNDPLIVLARNQTGTPTLDAGIIIERGDSNNAAIYWDESEDRFGFTTTSETGSTAGNIALTDYASIKAKAATFTGALAATSATFTGVITADAGLVLNDNDKIKLGTSGDLEIYHGGGENWIADTGSGDLNLSTNGNRIKLWKGIGTEALANFEANGAVTLYYDNAAKLATTSTGVAITGDLTVSGTIDCDTIDGVDSSQFIRSDVSDTVTNHTTWSDWNSVRFGDSTDMQIYHDGTHSYIKQTGTGNLRLATAEFRVTNAAVNETIISASQDNGVDLYFNDSLKLSTTSTGVSVTGTATFSGGVNLSTNQNVHWGDTYSFISGDGTNTTGHLKFYTSDTLRLTIAGNGAATFNGSAGNGYVGFKDGTTLSGYVGSGNSLSGSPTNDNNDFICRAVDSFGVVTNNTGGPKFYITAAGAATFGGTVTVTGTVFPTTNLGYDLGSNALRWNVLYANTGNFTGSISLTANEGVLLGATTEKIFGTSNYVIIDGANGTIMRDSGVNKVIQNGDLFRPDANNTVHLGTTDQRWAGTWSVLGNFSGALTGTTGTFTGSVSIAGSTGNLTLPADGASLKLGASGDLQMWHGSDGHSYLSNTTGAFWIKSTVTDGDIVFSGDRGDGGGTFDYFSLDGGSTTYSGGTTAAYTKWQDNSRIALGSGKDLQLFHDGTNSQIRNETGNLDFEQHANDGNIRFYCDDSTGGAELYFYLDGADTSANPITRLPDSARLAFGNSKDLQIYHDGSNSYINETGTGGLIVKGSTLYLRNPSDQDMIYAASGAEVKLYHNNAVKLTTASGGVDVTGFLTLPNTYGLTWGDLTNRIEGHSTNNTVDIYTNNTLAFSLSAAQTATFSGDLTVNADAEVNGKVKIHPANEATDTFRIYRGVNNGYHLDWLTIDMNAAQANFKTVNSDEVPYFPFKFLQQNSSTTVERMRIASDGKVGIGNTNPSTILSLGGSLATGGIHINSGADEDHTIIDMTGITGGGKLIWDDSEEAFSMSKGLRVTSGNVGIGTASPGKRLTVVADDSTAGNWQAREAVIRIQNIDDVAADSRFAGCQFAFSPGHDSTADNYVVGTVGAVLTDTSTQWAGDLVFGVKSATTATTISEAMRIQTGGNVGIGTTGPSSTLSVSHATSNAAAIRVFRSNSIPGTYMEMGTIGGSGKLNCQGGSIVFQLNGTTNSALCDNGNWGIKYDTAAHATYDFQIGSYSIAEDRTLAILGDNMRTATLRLADENDNYGFDIRNNGASSRLEFVRHSNNSTGTVAAVIERDSGDFGIGTTSPSSRIHGVDTLSAATGNEVAYNLSYTTNKATSGNDTGLLVAMTNTASPGTSLLLDLQVTNGGGTKFKVLDGGHVEATGYGIFGDTLRGVRIQASANGSASLPAFAFGGQTNYGFYRSSNDIRLSMNGADKVTVLQDGKVGIGTTAPAKKFVIKESSTTNQLHILQTVGGSNHLAGYAVGIGLDPEGYMNRNKIVIAAEGTSSGYSRGKLHFLLDAANDSGEATLAESRMTIQDDGKVGIGTNAPGAILDARGDTHIGKVSIPSTNSRLYVDGPNASRSNLAHFYNNDMGHNSNVNIWIGKQSAADKAFSLGYHYDNTAAARYAWIIHYGDSPGAGMNWLKGGKVGIGTTSPAAKLDVIAHSAESWEAIRASGSVKYYTTTSDGSELRYAFNMGGASDAAYQYLYKGDASTIGISLNAGGDTYFNGGSVGIGTSAPDHILELSANSSTATTAANIQNNSVIGLHIANTGNNAGCGPVLKFSDGADARTTAIAHIQEGSGTAAMAFYSCFSTNAVERMRIKADGNVGIGTAAPGSYKLYVNGTTLLKNAVECDDTLDVGNNVTIDGIVGMGGSPISGYRLYSEGHNRFTGICDVAVNTNTNLRVNGATHSGETWDGAIHIKNSSTIGNETSNEAVIYAEGGELKCMDDDRNRTTLSSHEDGKWCYKSDNTKTGRSVVIRMEDLVKAVEEHLGVSFSEIIEGE